MKVFLDDERRMPKMFDKRAYTADEMISLIKQHHQEITLISLDHDLGQQKTGMDVVNFIEQAAFHGEIEPFDINIHTANPAAVKAMLQGCCNAARFWSERKGKPCCEVVRYISDWYYEDEKDDDSYKASGWK